MHAWPFTSYNSVQYYEINSKPSFLYENKTELSFVPELYTWDLEKLSNILIYLRYICEYTNTRSKRRMFSNGYLLLIMSLTKGRQ